MKAGGGRSRRKGRSISSLCVSGMPSVSNSTAPARCRRGRRSRVSCSSPARTARGESSGTRWSWPPRSGRAASRSSSPARRAATSTPGAAQRGIPTLPFQVRNSGDLGAARRLARLIRSHGIDIVHAHSRRDYVVAVLGVRLARTRQAGPARPHGPAPGRPAAPRRQVLRLGRGRRRRRLRGGLRPAAARPPVPPRARPPDLQRR